MPEQANISKQLDRDLARSEFTFHPTSLEKPPYRVYEKDKDMAHLKTTFCKFLVASQVGGRED